MINKEQIILEAKKVHGDKYKYNFVENIKNVNIKIKIVCPVHGIFEQTYWNHIRQNKGCKLCGRQRTIEAKRLSIETFIERSKKTHEDIENYDFSNVKLEEKDEKGRIKMFCKQHGEFFIRKEHFMNGVGCQKCLGHKHDDKEVQKELSKLHPNLDFSETKFSDHNENYKISVICPKHGLRKLNYFSLKRGCGCDLCKWEKGGLKNRMKYDEFVKRAEKTYGKGTYFYNKDIMTNRDEKGRIKITCPIHGSFWVNLSNFLLRKSSCLKCSMSLLEKEMTSFLSDRQIVFERQKTFAWLKNNKNLYLDFFLPQQNIGIECQGLQHFKNIEYFGGEEGFKKRKENDKIKNFLCKQHGIKVLYFSHENINFPYEVFNSTDILFEYITKEKDNI